MLPERVHEGVRMESIWRVTHQRDLPKRFGPRLHPLNHFGVVRATLRSRLTRLFKDSAGQDAVQRQSDLGGLFLMLVVGSRSERLEVLLTRVHMHH